MLICLEVSFVLLSTKTVISYYYITSLCVFLLQRWCIVAKNVKTTGPFVKIHLQTNKCFSFQWANRKENVMERYVQIKCHHKTTLFNLLCCNVSPDGSQDGRRPDAQHEQFLSSLRPLPLRLWRPKTFPRQWRQVSPIQMKHCLCRCSNMSTFTNTPSDTFILHYRNLIFSLKTSTWCMKALYIYPCHCREEVH